VSYPGAKLADVTLQPYRHLLRMRDARRVLLLGMLIRVPLFASEVVLTLHVVAHLHRSYAAAGLATAVLTVALAVSGPWRGRRLDRVGLRRTLLPSIVVLTACWSVAPFVGYPALLPLLALGGLFVVPTFSIIRQVLLHTVPESDHKSALALDSVLVEISFMIGPALGVLAATYLDTRWALLGFTLADVAGGALLWLVNPPLRRADSEERRRQPMSSWATPQVLGVLAVCVVTTVVLVGTDVATVAAYRHMGHQAAIGWALALWGLGSAIGGLVYGAARRPVPVFVLLGCLAAVTVPVALAPNWLVLAGLLVVAGLLCAPTITATVEQLSRLVPESVRGEAMGWHGSALTAGSAIGAPVAGVAIDATSWRGGFLLPAVLGLLAAAAGLLLIRRQPAAPVADQPELASVASCS
jgi:MFS family permease